MERIFDKNVVRLQLLRDDAEEKLIANRAEFETKLAKILKNVDIYRTKDSPFLTKEEMRINSLNLKGLSDELQICADTADVNTFVKNT